MPFSAKDIFLEALDVPPPGRTEWLRARCGDDALFAQVQALLDAHEQASVFDRGPVIAAPTVGPPQTKTTPETPGLVVDGKYEIVSTLGEGGFGIVYLARQLTPVVRDVALKILRTGLDSHQIVARFEAERQTLALMDHPGIARVYDAGETAQGRPYIAMEFVAGEPITAYCDRHGLGIEARLRLVEQVCNAIQHAHSKGVIHRDLKPSNILVTVLDGEPFPTIIDFGIAKAVDPDALSAIHGGVELTHEFQIIGTPQYMSPEQAMRGDARNVDTRSDIYSIGTVLYELIAGVPPFDPAELRRAGLDGLLRVIRDQTPPRPSTRLSSLDRTAPTAQTSVRTASRRVAGDIDWIVMRAMEKEPSRRYQTAAELAADIRRHLAHEPVLAGPPSRWYAAKKFIRRHRVAVGAAAVVAIALVTTAAISIASANRAMKAEAVAVENERKAQRELTKAVAVADFTRELLSGVAPAVARGRDTTLLRELLDAAADTAPRSIESEGLIDLAVRHLIANVMSELGEFQRAYDVLRPAWDATDVLTERQARIERLNAVPQLGELLGELGRLQEASDFLRQALDEYNALGLGKSAGVVEVMNALSHIALLDDPAEGKRWAEQALAIARAIPGIDPQTIHTANDRLANALALMRDDEAAIRIWEENLAEVMQRKGKDALETMSIRASLGSVYQNVGRWEDAEKSLVGALEAMRKTYQPNNPRVIATLNIYGMLLEDRGRYEEAVRVLEEARAHYGDLEDESTKLVIDARLARSLAGLGQFDRAIEMDRQILARLASADPSDESSRFVVLWHLVQAQTQAGRPGEAITSLAAHTPKDGWSDAIVPFNHAVLELAVAQAHLDLGELKEAAEHAAAAKDFLAEDGRVRGRYVRQLQWIESGIATAATRPTTLPSR